MTKNTSFSSKNCIINNKGVAKQYYSSFTNTNGKDKSKSFHPKTEMSDEEFIEWFRGFTDGESCFSIKKRKSLSKCSFQFQFQIGLHKDDTPVLNFIKKRLNVGIVSELEKTSIFLITKTVDLKIIIDIFSKVPLNTTKRLDFEIWKQAYELYIQVQSNKGQMDNNATLLEKIEKLKKGINRGRVYKESTLENIIISDYWLLGFLEGESSFSVTKDSFRVRFGLGQVSREKPLLEKIISFLLLLPGNSSFSKSPWAMSNSLYKSRLNRKPISEIYASNTQYFREVFVPYLESLKWVSKKELDFKDWCAILSIKAMGHHLTPKGKEIILKIISQMNSNRLSTNSTHVLVDRAQLDKDITEILAGPSNFEITASGEIKKIYSGRIMHQNVRKAVELINEEGEIFKSFDSVKQCAIFLNAALSSTYKQIKNNKPIYYENQIYFIKYKN